MISIALRFAEKFAPDEGTIAAHNDLITKNGFVWYGKMGNAVSKVNIDKVLAEDNSKILLIHSGSTKRYWAHVEDIKSERPPFEAFPSYYHDISDKFKTWFKITHIEEAPKNVMSLCKVASSGQVLSIASKHSMSPYFVIEID